MATEEQMNRAREELSWPLKFAQSSLMRCGLTEAESLKLMRDTVNAKTDAEREREKRMQDTQDAIERQLYRAAGLEIPAQTDEEKMRKAAGLPWKNDRGINDQIKHNRGREYYEAKAEADPVYAEMRKMAGLA